MADRDYERERREREERERREGREFGRESWEPRFGREWNREPWGESRREPWWETRRGHEWEEPVSRRETWERGREEYGREREPWGREFGREREPWEGRGREWGREHEPFRREWGTYGGGMGYGGFGAYTGGMGTYGERGRFAGRGPKNYQRSDDRIRDDINERLTQHPYIDATEIDVQVKSGEVTLTGTVENRESRRMAEDVAENVFGVKDVHNQIRVQQREVTIQK